MQALLKSRISQERNEIKRLMEMLTELGTEKKKPKERTHSPNEAEMTAMIQLVKENQLLEVCSSAPIVSSRILTYFSLVTEKNDDTDTQYYRRERCLCGAACSVGGASTDGQDLTANLLVTHRNYKRHLYVIRYYVFAHNEHIYSL